MGKRREPIVILDANFILLPFQFKIDYFSEISDLISRKARFITYQQVLDELEAKRRREPNATKFQRQLDAGLRYLENQGHEFNLSVHDEVKSPQETTDEFLLNKAVELKEKGRLVYLATNDSEMRRIARTLDLNVIFLRQKKYLSIG